eukprot:6919752-Alexandrium_andersonii.AAC.1
MDALAAKLPLVNGSLEHNDLFYVPAGWFVCQQAKAMSSAVQVSLLSKSGPATTGGVARLSALTQGVAAVGPLQRELELLEKVSAAVGPMGHVAS